MAAIEHYTRHKALKCGDIYSSRYGTPLPACPFAWNLPIDIKISFSNFLQLTYISTSDVFCQDPDACNQNETKC